MRELQRSGPTRLPANQAGARLSGTRYNKTRAGRRGERGEALCHKSASGGERQNVLTNRAQHNENWHKTTTCLDKQSPAQGELAQEKPWYHGHGNPQSIFFRGSRDKRCGVASGDEKVPRRLWLTDTGRRAA